MIKVQQTRTGLDGNCFQACVASILELPLEAVPDFCNIYSEADWWDRFQEWLEEFELGAINLYLPKNEKQKMSVLPYMQEVILSGPSPRNLGHQHAVVGRYDEEKDDIITVWDPHPSDAGIVDVDEMLFFVTRYPEQQFYQKLHMCGICKKQFVETAQTDIGPLGEFCTTCLTEDAKKTKAFLKAQRRKSCTKER